MVILWVANPRKNPIIIVDLSLEEIDSVLDIISQSKNLTFLKIKALGRSHVPNLRPHPVDELVSMALQSCPKLTHLEIIEPDYMASE